MFCNKMNIIFNGVKWGTLQMFSGIHLRTLKWDKNPHKRGSKFRSSHTLCIFCL